MRNLNVFNQFGGYDGDRTCSYFFAGFFIACGSSVATAAPQCIKPEAPRRLPDADLKTVVLTKQKNPAIFQGGEFSFARTLDNILKTASDTNIQPTAQDRENLLTSLLRGLRATKLTNADSGLTFEVVPRPGESALEAKALLDAQGPSGMQPVGLFNRLDLTPKSLSNCGEYRIVYAKNNSGGAFDNRFFLIFEAALPNPEPNSGVAGCQQVAKLWESFKGSADATIRQALVKFYYAGGSINTGGPNFEPVIDFRHFGLPSGQVRANAFVQPANEPWHLRQWKIKLNAQGIPGFDATPVNENPVPGFFGGTPPLVSPIDAFNKTAGRFRNDFVGVSVGQLTAVDSAAATFGTPTTEQDLIAGVGVDIEDEFYAVESAADPSDDPTPRASGGLSALVTDQIKKLKLDAACGLTAEHVLNRMGAMTCGGCHQFSNGKDIEPGIKWPSSLGFVQIDESGSLSNLLLDRFLPARAALTQKVAGGESFLVSILGATNLQKQLDLKTLLDPTQQRLQSPTAVANSSQIEALSNHLRGIEAKEPGAFVLFRKPD